MFIMHYKPYCRTNYLSWQTFVRYPRLGLMTNACIITKNWASIRPLHMAFLDNVLPSHLMSMSIFVALEFKLKCIDILK
jgi:hypothetical protein